MQFFIGQIVLFSFGYAPRTFMLCQGQTLSIEQYPALFAVIGITYGGDGQKTFMLPDTTKVDPVSGFNYAICVDGEYPTRS